MHMEKNVGNILACKVENYTALICNSLFSIVSFKRSTFLSSSNALFLQGRFNV